jgi:hypothetical protein
MFVLIHLGEASLAAGFGSWWFGDNGLVAEANPVGFLLQIHQILTQVE